MVESIYEESCLNKNAVTLIEVSLERTSHGFVFEILNNFNQCLGSGQYNIR